MRILALMMVLGLLSHAEENELNKGPGLKIGLISDVASVAAGKPFVVGLHIEHFPHFHTYWRNPGMVGMATSLKWSLPKGFTASEIEWPYPEKTFMAEYPCHGYERDVTLLVTITPPDKLPKEKATIIAEASWMCCAKGCFPGFETFSLTLPVTQTALPDSRGLKLVTKARSELPTTKHGVTATLLSKTGAPLIEVVFKGVADMTPKDLYFFSNDRQISSDHPQKFESRPDGSILLRIPRSEFSPENKTTIPGVLKMGSKYLAIEARPKT